MTGAGEALGYVEQRRPEEGAVVDVPHAFDDVETVPDLEAFDPFSSSGVFNVQDTPTMTAHDEERLRDLESSVTSIPSIHQEQPEAMQSQPHIEQPQTLIPDFSEVTLKEATRNMPPEIMAVETPVIPLPDVASSPTVAPFDSGHVRSPVITQ